MKLLQQQKINKIKQNLNNNQIVMKNLKKRTKRKVRKKMKNKILRKLNHNNNKMILKNLICDIFRH